MLRGHVGGKGRGGSFHRYDGGVGGRSLFVRVIFLLIFLRLFQV